MSADRPAKGIRRTGSGWQVYVRVKGEFRSKHFPPNTDLVDLKAWRSQMKARGWLAQPEPDMEADTFADDCAQYLKLVAGMTTIKDRTYRIHQWRDTLGANRARASITSLEIRHQLERWRLTGLSPASLNLRRTALMHLFTVLDGKSARNPVRDVPPFRETPKAVRLPTLAEAKKALAVHQRDTKTKARLAVLLWTGWPPAQLMRVKESDVDWKAATARLPGRRKGKGTAGRVLPLLPQAVAALRRLRREDAFGQFSTSGARRALRLACQRAKVPVFTPYALRHLFLTTVALATKDDRVVAELAQHADIRMTRRYTQASVDPRLTAGLKLVEQALKAK